MEIKDSCIFCGVGVDPVKQELFDENVKKWTNMCMESICCLFQIPSDHTLPGILTTAHYCDKCRQLVRDIDFTLRLFNQLLHRLETVQKEILHNLSSRREGDDYEMKDVKHSYDLINEMFREGSANINVGIDQLKNVMSLGRLTQHNNFGGDNCSKGANNIERVKVLQGRKLVVTKRQKYSDNEILTVKVETELREGVNLEDLSQDYLSDGIMDQDDKNNWSEGNLSDQELSDSSNSTDYEENHVKKPRRKLNPLPKKIYFQCSLCKVKVSSELSLNCHRRKVHEEDPVPFHCDKCPQKFKFYKSLMHHKSTDCGRLSSHQSRPHPSETFLCEFCSKKYSSANYLAKHVAIFHTQQHCDFCNFGFETVQEVGAHEELHKKCERDAPFQCVLCNEVLTNSSNLKKHVIVSHTDRQVVCDICGVKFMSVSHMKKHQKMHQAGYVGHKCDICGYTFSRASGLKHHMLKHSKTKSFTCEICGKGFRYQSGLTVHLASHQEERKFICKICKHAFSAKCFLMRHEEIHSGTSAYECPTCGKKFKTRNSLSQHVATHLPKDPNRKTRVRKSQKAGDERDEGVQRARKGHVTVNNVDVVAAGLVFQGTHSNYNTF